MPKTKSCQRCYTEFTCGANDNENCQCFTIKLENRTTEFLKITNYDCLCNQCLTEVNELVENFSDKKLPKNPSELVEGVHYYIQNGLYVFTETYHFLRGNCCGNGCKHCAYGHIFIK